MKNIEDFNEHLTQAGYTVLSRVSCTDGSAWVTIQYHEVKHSDKTDVVFNMLTLGDGTKVHISIVTPQEYGYASPPVLSESLGERVGCLNLSQVLQVLPEVYTDKQAAKAYLSRNPDMLVSLLSNTLSMQAKALETQQSMLQRADEVLATTFQYATKRFKRLYTPFLGNVLDKAVFKELHSKLKEEN